MLDIALQFLKDELSSYIVARTGSTAVEVKLTKVVDDLGKYAFLEETIGVSVVNIEEERVMKDQLPRHTYVDGQHVVLEPELRLNLYVLFAANFKQYDQGLKYLAHIMTFFQAHTIFTSERYPALDARITKLTAELQSLSFEQINQLWASIGGKLLPFMVYKFRMVVLQDVEPTAVQPPITTIDTRTETK